VFIFGAGEEVSWGQRLFNLETPELFQKYNAQKETNIHNFVVYGVKINKLVFSKILGIVAIMYTLLIPYLYRKKKGMKKFIDSFAIPIPMVHHVLSILLVLILINLIPDSKIGELLEFGGSYIFVLIVLYPYNKDIFQGT
jgi:H+/Cl- antiporter ClcA